MDYRCCSTALRVQTCGQLRTCTVLGGVGLAVVPDEAVLSNPESKVILRKFT